MTREATTTKCYCPGDCNCRHTGQPWNRFNYCGCRAHDATPTTTGGGRGEAMPRKVKGYEEGFAYGEECARRMERSRRIEQAEFVRASGEYSERSPTSNYWRGYVSAMETTTF